MKETKESKTAGLNPEQYYPQNEDEYDEEDESYVEFAVFKDPGAIKQR